MGRSYTMRGVQGTADRAVALARAVLTWKAPGSRIHDVQNDPRFQHRGVDLLWEHGDQITGVEVKGDRNATRGNYFLELVSNLERDTPGCFLYSTADLVLYAFVDALEVHWIPLPPARRWFLPNAARFPLRHTQTRLGQTHYTTVGALVPVRALLLEVPDSVRYRLSSEWEINAVPLRTARGARP
jgi:hypothetical protein